MAPDGIYLVNQDAWKTDFLSLQAAVKGSAGKPRTPRLHSAAVANGKGTGVKRSAGGKTKVAVKHEPDSKPPVRKAGGGKAAVKQEGHASKRVAVKQEDKVAREKKVFEKLGQKKETPEVRRLPTECATIVQRVEGSWRATGSGSIWDPICCSAPVLVRDVVNIQNVSVVMSPAPTVQQGKAENVQQGD